MERSFDRAVDDRRQLDWITALRADLESQASVEEYVASLRTKHQEHSLMRLAENMYRSLQGQDPEERPEAFHQFMNGASIATELVDRFTPYLLEEDGLLGSTILGVEDFTGNAAMLSEFMIRDDGRYFGPVRDLVERCKLEVATHDKEAQQIFGFGFKCLWEYASALDVEQFKLDGTVMEHDWDEVFFPSGSGQ